MVKFKMKLVFIVGVSAFMTITMVLYVSSLSGIDLFNFSNNYKNNVLNENFQNGLNKKLSWHHFKRNPKNQTELVEMNLSKSYLSFHKTKYNRDEIYTKNNDFKKNSQISFFSNEYVDDYDDNNIHINEGAAIEKNISYLFNNKSIYNHFKKRRDFMLNKCSRTYNKSSVLNLQREKLEHILVDEKNKLLFCYIPKVACTNWKRMFMLLTGKSNNYSYVINLPSYEVHSRSLFASLQNYTKKDIDFFIKNFTKLIFVRNPLERLLSAYRNKLEQHYNSSKYFQARFGKYIIKKYRSTPNSLSLLKGDDVTFTEFVTYLISSPKDEFNEHWQTMNDLCLPCYLKYDLIGNYDTLNTDARYLLDIFNISFPFPSLPKPSKTAASLNEYYDQLSPKLFSQLQLLYDMDFKLFNFSADLYS